MKLDEIITAGTVREDTYSVEMEHMAIHIGSGSARVLATPWMIAFMERTSHRLLAGCLPEGFTSVGIRVDVRHLAATPIGGTIRVRAEILAVDGFRVTLKVNAWDEVEKIGEGNHERYIIDEKRFLTRVEAKKG